jgi:hypothetical protein
MTQYRDHDPIPIEEFNGLWDRGDEEDVPLDHFRDCENIDTSHFGSGFRSRDGLGQHQNVAAPLGNIIRMHNYVMQTGYTLLVLVRDTTVSTTYKLYHVVNDASVLGPIHTLTGQTTTPDFKCVSYNGRAYISFFATFGTGDTAIEKGLQNEFVYVYAGDGTAIRKAAGTKPDESMDLTITVSASAGATDAGLHTFGVCFETSSGFITAPGRLSSFTTVADHGVDFADIPISADPNVVARRLVASTVIPNFNGDTAGFTFYFIPDGRIANNSATTLSNISFYDADLVEDASHLIDNYAEIPAGAALGLYQNRLCVGATYTDISLALVSAAGEPEAISQIDGLLIVPLDGTAITTFAELRDILYVFKRAKTVAYSDNGDVPSSWPFSQVDQAIGCPVHGIATVIDSGGISIDFLITASFAGIMIFNGQYAKPELTWKVQELWFNQDRNEFKRIQLCNDVISKSLFVTLPDYRLLKADYSDGLDPKKIKWWPQRFDIRATTIALTNIDDLIIGSETRLTS